MRSNGLPAARFDVLRDVDQLLSPRLLQLLAEAGIAAYARQRANAVDPTRFDVVDRLWVDATRREDAARLVEDHLPDLTAHLDRPTDDDDAIFAQIVAGWDDDGGPPVGAWPVQEDLDPENDAEREKRFEDERAADDAGNAAEGATRRRRLVRPAARDRVPAEDDDDPEDHFVPEPPPPLPSLDKLTAVALGALALGIGGLFVLWAFGITIDSRLQWTALVIGLAGATTLVVRMRDTVPPEEGGPDNGAVL